MAEYIEREAFKAEILRLSTHYLNEWDTLGVLAAADRIPAADVRPVVHGRWVTRPYMMGKTEYCSRCGENYGRKHNFCPNCGADMRPQPPKEETND